tara:strand:+ start:926 stop:1381 length:456 start_codon:yes stop_codon:yes gene_type:complete
MKNRIKTKLYFISLSSLIILIDQYSKNFIYNEYKSLVYKYFILFKIDFVKNYGAAFNIFSGNRIFLSLTSIIFALILLYLLVIKDSNNTIKSLAYSFILGGTIGNGLDRILRGYVIDFININFINFPVFNFADISINIGFILLIYIIFKQR